MIKNKRYIITLHSRVIICQDHAPGWGQALHRNSNNWYGTRLNLKIYFRIKKQGPAGLRNRGFASERKKNYCRLGREAFRTIASVIASLASCAEAWGSVLFGGFRRGVNRISFPPPFISAMRISRNILFDILTSLIKETC